MAETFFTALQAEIKARLEADDYFSDITVLSAADKMLENTIQELLGALLIKASKRGVCVIIEEPTGEDNYPNVALGPITAQFGLLVYELPSINRDTATDGTGKHCLHVCRRIHRVLKPFQAEGVAVAFTPKKPFMEPIEVNSIFEARRVQFTAQEADPEIFTVVQPVVITANPALSSQLAVPTGSAGATVTLACSTSGATIRYTTDGTPPSLTNGSTYSAPFTAAAGLLRCGAFKTGSINSILTAAKFT